MQVHGNTRWLENRREWIVRREDLSRSTLHCSVDLALRLVHCKARKQAPEQACRITRTFSMSKKQYRIAVIPGDGIGKEVMPEGLRVIEAAAKKHGVSLVLRSFRLRVVRLLREARPDDAGRLEGANRQARCDLFRCGRLAREDPGPHLAVGLADQVPQGVRSICEFASGAADAGRAVAARGPQARRHRFLGGAREHRGRIFERRRPHVPGHRPRVRHAADGDDPRRRRPHFEVRVRAGAVAAEEAPDLGDQVQRHLHHHALLGRARGGDGQAISAR